MKTPPIADPYSLLYKLTHLRLVTLTRDSIEIDRVRMGRRRIYDLRSVRSTSIRKEKKNRMEKLVSLNEISLATFAYRRGTLLLSVPGRGSTGI